MKHFFLLSLIISSISFNLTAQKQAYKPVSFPDGYNQLLDVIYTQVNGWDGRMDLYFNTKSATPTPIVINIHGGGWNHGEKESQSGFGSFFKNGYAIANVEYRLVDVAPAPAAIEDVRCALIYLYNNANALNIDTNKIVIMGGSSGGHLALMAGLLGNDKQFDTNCSYDGDIKIAAIIDKYGVSNLLPLASWKSAKNWLGINFNNTIFIESVSPLFHVSKTSPPTFIVHGNEDPIVPYSQSETLYKKLKEFNITTEFLTIPGGKHGKFSTEENALLSKRMWLFLNALDL